MPTMTLGPEPIPVEIATRRLLAQARQDEPRITELVVGVAEECGGSLAGLDHRVKGYDSLVRKLSGRLRRTPTRGVEDIASQIYDPLRYTVVSEVDDYLAVHRAVLDQLRRRGVQVVSVSNRWAGPGYRGINVHLRAGDCQFEVQFHTNESYQIVVETHARYEEMRREDTLEERRAELEAMIEFHFGRVVVPPGAVQ